VRFGIASLLLLFSLAGQPLASAPAKPKLVSHMLFDSARGHIVAIGGSRETSKTELWSWDGKSWTRISADGPPARELGCAAYDSARKKIVLQGGIGAGDARLSDTWEWDGTAWSQIPDVNLGSRNHHKLAYDAARQRTVCFSGTKDEKTLASDTWEWDGATWKQAATTGPGPRAHTAMVYDNKRNVVLLFGGLGMNPTSYGDTWDWDGKTWKQLPGAGPSPRTHLAMAFDADTGAAILFGGLNRGNPADALADTWMLDHGQWTKIDTPGPAKRSGHVMAYDPLRFRTVLYGGGSWDGKTSTNHSDTWEWDGQQWKQCD
jgi:hypothetical protein